MQLILIGLVLIGLFANYWIVGICAVALVCSFAKYREIERLLPMAGLVFLGLGFLFGEVVRHGLHWWSWISGAGLFR